MTGQDVLSEAVNLGDSAIDAPSNCAARDTREGLKSANSFVSHCEVFHQNCQWAPALSLGLWGAISTLAIDMRIATSIALCSMSLEAPF